MKTVDSQVVDPQALQRRLVERRAVEAAIWGMPIVAADAIRQGFLRDIKAKFNDIAYFSQFADSKFQTTTPNASTYYFYSAYSTKQDGPIVLEVPPAVGAGIYGQFCDMWDAPLAIVGPGGENKGNGGKYVVLPPDFEADVPSGCVPVRQQTYGGFWLMRTIPKSASPADTAAAIALLKRFRMYPLSRSANPPEQLFIDAYGKLWDGIPRMDETFYEVLAKMVNEEPVLQRDLAMMNMLKSIGIEKGKEFKPDGAMTTALRNAVHEAKGLLQNMQHRAVVQFWDSAHWGLPDTSGVKTEFSYQSADMLDYDRRGMLNLHAWGPPKKSDESAPTIYISTFYDNQGRPLSGNETYRLHVPPNVPVAQYWSATVYDDDTAAFVREAPFVSLDSNNPKAAKNPDGSMDILFAPEAPANHEDNWLATNSGGSWFAIFRLCGPTKAFFDKAWTLPDIERVG